MEDGMLCVDLTEQGIVITGNRTKAVASAESAEHAEAPTEDTPAEVPAEDPDHP